MTNLTWTLEPDPEGGWKLYRHDVYERGSVLEGSPRRSLRGFYDTVVDALNKNPLIYIDVIEGSTKIDHVMPDCPPRGFSPLDAGEEW
jgi:hypothetical protein